MLLWQVLRPFVDNAVGAYYFLPDPVRCLVAMSQDASSVMLALSLDGQLLDGRRLRVQQSNDKAKPILQKTDSLTRRRLTVSFEISVLSVAESDSK